ncbi:MAG: putative FlaG/YvyC family protein [Phenylobacterium sp.]
MSINNISTTVGGQSAPQLTSVNRASEPSGSSQEVKIPEKPSITETVSSKDGNSHQQNIQVATPDNAKDLSGVADKQIAGSKEALQSIGNNVKDNAANQEAEKKEVESLMASLQKASADNANQASSLQIRKLEFSTAQESGRTIVKVIDKENNDVIRQIPSEEFIRAADKINDLSQQGNSKPGLLFESKA